MMTERNYERMISGLSGQELLLWQQTGAETGFWHEKHRVISHAVKMVFGKCKLSVLVQWHLFIRIMVFWGFGSSQQFRFPSGITRRVS